MTRYTIEQITAHHIHRYSNVSPRDIGLWVYIVDGRAYGFTTTKELAKERAIAGLGND